MVTAAELFALMKLTPEELAKHMKTVTTFVEPPYSGIEEFMEEYAALCAKHPLRGVLTAENCADGIEATLSTALSQYTFFESKGVEPSVRARATLPAILELSLTPSPSWRGFMQPPPTIHLRVAW